MSVCDHETLSIRIYMVSIHKILELTCPLDFQIKKENK